MQICKEKQYCQAKKAFAYKMKLDAIKRQGKTSVQVAEKLLSVEKVAEEAGESKDQVRRYIRLTYLIPELLSMVDDNKIAFNPSEEKPNQKEQIKLPRDELRKYFPQNYSDEQIKRDILKGLELLKRQRERNRDAR